MKINFRDMDDDMWNKASSVEKKSDKEILDDMDITVIENYLREKKLLRLTKIIKKK